MAADQYKRFTHYFPGRGWIRRQQGFPIYFFACCQYSKTIGGGQRKINLVLQNQTTSSNAYVGLGPFRSEFLLTPYQNSFELGSLPWPDQLTIHEFRHVQQFNNFNVGLSKAMRIIFGEEGQAVANNAAIPNGFLKAMPFLMRPM